MARGIGWKSTVGCVVLVASVVAFSPVTLNAERNEPATARLTAVPSDVTFTKHIVPILQRSCQNCHRPDGVAPMSLITYE
jgi:hypothetical protein